ncbi:Major structural subunit of bundle-forming pilus [Methylobacterium hispanicum]|uniref:Major structural subunit of bundle-forming pilus n=1 Tax=Methylobacterium hispanicum TaxID=270350 RepID=A0AAV4ZRP5_9HYPH|nr:type 4 pilus major pilin [Methylobacterium hispanicum]GJD90736.1 Major structural subunit of bundle-forming pilus [Methylobacterium hispanicum]
MKAMMLRVAGRGYEVRRELAAIRAAARRRGLTLIETAMVLALAAVFLAGVMLFFQNASVGSKTNEATSQLAAIQQAIRTVYAGQASYITSTGTMEQALIATRSVPAKMVTADGAGLRHAFNGPVLLGATADGANFQVVFNGLPSDACSKMLTMDFGRGLLTVSGSSSVQSLGGSGGSSGSTGPMNPVEAGQACGNNNTSSIAWTFF